MLCPMILSAPSGGSPRNIITLIAFAAPPHGRRLDARHLLLQTVVTATVKGFMTSHMRADVISIPRLNVTQHIGLSFMMTAQKDKACACVAPPPLPSSCRHRLTVAIS